MAERAWIRGAQRGSVADLERLFREHWPRAFRAARLVTGDAAAAEDIAQEAFLAAIRNLDRFDRVFGQVFKNLEGDAAIEGVLANIPEEWLKAQVQRERDALGTMREAFQSLATDALSTSRAAWSPGTTPT